MTTVLITGASSGIGKDIALRLLDAGYSVYATARRTERMADLAERGAGVLELDITKEDTLGALVSRVMVEAGSIDVLINNAGFGLYAAMEDTPIADARRQFEVNLFGPARLTQLVLPHMREQGSGRIVNISSMGGRIYTPLGSWYHASKHALEGWSDCLRLELAPFGIDVIVIEPGLVRSGFGGVAVGPLLERSGQSAYSGLAVRVAKRMQDSYASNAGSAPKVVSDVVLRALQAERPKTRYVAGKYARPMMALRKWFGDRIFDRIVMSRF